MDQIAGWSGGCVQVTSHLTLHIDFHISALTVATHLAHAPFAIALSLLSCSRYTRQIHTNTLLTTNHTQLSLLFPIHHLIWLLCACDLPPIQCYPLTTCCYPLTIRCDPHHTLLPTNHMLLPTNYTLLPTNHTLLPTAHILLPHHLSLALYSSLSSQAVVVCL